jgi:hypothetical protein
MTHLPARIALRSAMLLVALVAVDCSLVRSPWPGRPLEWILLGLGALPMANLLAVIGLVLLPGPGTRLDRPFLTRFALAGCGVVLVYTWLATHHAEGIREWLSGTLMVIRPGPRLTLPAASALLVLPQLALALAVAVVIRARDGEEPLQTST